MARSKSSLVCSMSDNPDLDACALFTNVFILPNVSTVLAMTSLMRASSAPSATMASTLMPYSSSSLFFASSNRDSVLPVMTRFEPSLAKAHASPNPIPLPPPVIIVTLSCSLFISIRFYVFFHSLTTQKYTDCLHLSNIKFRYVNQFFRYADFFEILRF